MWEAFLGLSWVSLVETRHQNPHHRNISTTLVPRFGGAIRSHSNLSHSCFLSLGSSSRYLSPRFKVCEDEVEIGPKIRFDNVRIISRARNSRGTLSPLAPTLWLYTIRYVTLFSCPLRSELTPHVRQLGRYHGRRMLMTHFWVMGENQLSPFPQAVATQILVVNENTD